MWLLLQITVFSKYNEDPKCYMFLESSQKTLIEYHHDNVQIHGHGPWVCPSIGLTPSVVCFWNFHRKCWWYQTLALPISVAMAMAMSIFDYFGSCWSFFWRQSGLLGPRAVLKEVAYRSTWTWLMMSGSLKVKKICNAFLVKLGCFNAF